MSREKFEPRIERECVRPGRLYRFAEEHPEIMIPFFIGAACSIVGTGVYLINYFSEQF